MREYVDIKGLIELRTVYDDPSYRDPENEEDDVDMLDFQEEWDCIPENFCAKDRDYGCQRIFFCLACDCDMKSLISLESHVGGSKHAKKAIELKRLKSGMAPIEPLEKKAKLLKPVVRADVSRTLVDRLKENPAFPALGLEHVIEFTNPTRPRDTKLYNCVQDGCKSAWGDSNDMYHHLCGAKLKHNKNYIIHSARDVRGTSLNKAEVMQRSQELDMQLRSRGGNERDYKLLQKVKDERKYREIKDRPADWSETKARVTGGAGGKRTSSSTSSANYEPMGSPKNPFRMMAEPERPWLRELTAREKADIMLEDLNRLQGQIETNLDLIRNRRRRDLKKVTKDAMEQFKYCVEVFQSTDGRSMVEKEFWDIKDSIEKLEEEFENVMNGDANEFRRIRDEMGNLDEEFKVFTGTKGDNEYNRLKERIVSVTKKLRAFQSDEPALHTERNQRLTEADGLLAKLNKTADQMSASVEKTRADRNMTPEQRHQAAFKRDLAGFIKEKLEDYFQQRPEMCDSPGWRDYLDSVLREFLKITYEGEINGHEKAGKPWEQLRLGNHIKTNVDKFVKRKMEQKINKNA